MLSRYDDVAAALRDPRWVSAVPGFGTVAAQRDAAIARRDARSILVAEGRPHQRLRQLAARAMDRRAVTAYRPRCRTIVEPLVGALAERGGGEMVTALCAPLAMRALVSVLGLPAADAAKLGAWSEQALAFLDLHGTADRPTYLAARRELGAYLEAVVAQRRADRGDDQLSHWIHEPGPGGPLEHEELVSFLEFLLIAGPHTTCYQLANLLSLLAEQPAIYRALRRDPGLVPVAVGESLRLRGSAVFAVRVASEDLEVGAIRFRRGARVLLNLRAANRDPAVFPRPLAFALDRGPGQPHLTFSAGHRACVGAQLARAELEEALAAVVARVARLELAAPIRWLRDAPVRGPAQLALRWCAA